MSTELFVIEDDNGEMLDSDDDGGFSVFYTQEDAQRAIEDIGDDPKLTIVRFERSDKLAALEAENARLREALEQVEWASSVVTELGNKFDYCPLCDQVKEKGHSPDCLVGAALGRQV